MENAARLIESRIFNVRNYRGEFFRLRPCLIGNVNLASAKRDAPHVVLVSCATTSRPDQRIGDPSQLDPHHRRIHSL